jgi:hypothetical protein
MFRMSSRISLGIPGQPILVRRLFHLQKSRSPLRCQAITVSCLTSKRQFRHFSQKRERRTHKIRSDVRIRIRFLLLLCSTMSWWRRARISICRDAWVRSVHLRAANVEISTSSVAQDNTSAKLQAQRFELLRSFWQSQGAGQPVSLPRPGFFGFLIRRVAQRSRNA